jgi:TonB family protein
VYTRLPKGQTKPNEEPKPDETMNNGNTSGQTDQNNDHGSAPHDGPQGKVGSDNHMKGTLKIHGDVVSPQVGGVGDPRENARHAGVMAFMNERTFSIVTDGTSMGPDQENNPGSDTAGMDPGGTGNWGSSFDPGDGTGGCPPGHYCAPHTIGKNEYATNGKDPGPGTNIDPSTGTKPGTYHPGVPHVPTKVAVDEDGGLDKDIVKREVAKHKAAIGYCYEKQLTVDPNLEGTVTLAFTIGMDGQMVSVNVQSSTIGSKEVDSCVRQEALTWKFPPSSGRTKVTYPFQFHVSGK